MIKLYMVKGNQLEEVISYTLLENGKYNYKLNCSKCGGSGKLNHFMHVDGGVCFKCQGSGHIIKSGNLYKYEDALNKIAKYEQKQQQKQQQQKMLEEKKLCDLLESLPSMVKIVVDSKSYEYKDTLKNLGYKWIKEIKSWVGENDVPLKYFEMPRMELVDLYENRIDVELFEERKKAFLQSTKPNYQFFSSKGVKEHMSLKIESLKEIGTKYGTSTRVVMFDKDKKHYFVAFTTSKKFLEQVEEGYTYPLEFTIKDHNEFNGIKQTIITKIKVK